jgi:hypothetical protein
MDKYIDELIENILNGHSREKYTYTCVYNDKARVQRRTYDLRRLNT